MPPSYSFTDSAGKVRGGETSRFILIGNPFRATITRSPATAQDAIDVQLYATDGTTALTASKRAYFVPTVAPLVVDFAPLAQDLVSLDRPNILNTTAPAYLSTHYKNVRIGYKDYTAGSYTVNANVYTLLNGVVQVGEDLTYGQNAAAYMSSLAFMGKFLTMLDVPTIWYTATAVFAPILCHLVGQDVVDEETAVPAGSVVVRQKIGSGAWANLAGYTASEKGMIAHPALFDAGTLLAQVTGQSTAQVQVWWASDAVPTLDTQIIETLNFKIKQACINPVFVSWLNSKGGYDVWCFEGQRPIETTAETVASYSVELGDMSTATGTSRTVRRSAEQIMSATALSLTFNEAEALKELLTSPTVCVYLHGIWQYVEVDGSITIDEYDTRHRLDISFVLPQIQGTNG